jgi:hypothetical protein
MFVIIPLFTLPFHKYHILEGIYIPYNPKFLTNLILSNNKYASLNDEAIHFSSLLVGIVSEVYANSVSHIAGQLLGK